jgi:hypothetical protein
MLAKFVGMLRTQPEGVAHSANVDVAWMMSRSASQQSKPANIYSISFA